MGRIPIQHGIDVGARNAKILKLCGQGLDIGQISERIGVNRAIVSTVICSAKRSGMASDAAPKPGLG
jgi:transposase